MKRTIHPSSVEDENNSKKSPTNSPGAEKDQPNELSASSENPVQKPTGDEDTATDSDDQEDIVVVLETPEPIRAGPWEHGDNIVDETLHSSEFRLSHRWSQNPESIAWSPPVLR